MKGGLSMSFLLEEAEEEIGSQIATEKEEEPGTSTQ